MLKKYFDLKFSVANEIAADLFTEPPAFKLVQWLASLLPESVKFLSNLLISLFKPKTAWGKTPFLSCFFQTLRNTIIIALLVGLGAAFSWILMPGFELHKKEDLGVDNGRDEEKGIALDSTQECKDTDQKEDLGVDNGRDEEKRRAPDSAQEPKDTDQSVTNKNSANTNAKPSLWQRVYDTIRFRWLDILKGLCLAPLLSLALVTCGPLALIEQAFYLCIYAIQCVIFVAILLLQPLLDLMLLAPAAFATGLILTYGCIRFYTGATILPMNLSVLGVTLCCLAGLYVMGFLSNHKLKGNETNCLKKHLLIISMIACIVGVASHLAMLHLFYAMGIVLCTLLLPWFTILYFNHENQHRILRDNHADSDHDARSSTTLNHLTQCLQTLFIGICVGMLTFYTGWCTLNLACTLTGILLLLAGLQYAYNVQTTPSVYQGVGNNGTPDQPKPMKTLLAWCIHEWQKVKVIIQDQSKNNHQVTDAKQSIDHKADPNPAFQQLTTDIFNHFPSQGLKSSKMDAKSPDGLQVVKRLQDTMKAMQEDKAMPNCEKPDNIKTLQTFTNHFRVLAQWQAFCTIWNQKITSLDLKKQSEALQILLASKIEKKELEQWQAFCTIWNQKITSLDLKKQSEALQILLASKIEKKEKEIEKTEQKIDLVEKTIPAKDASMQNLEKGELKIIAMLENLSDLKKTLRHHKHNLSDLKGRQTMLSNMQLEELDIGAFPSPNDFPQMIDWRKQLSKLQKRIEFLFENTQEKLKKHLGPCEKYLDKYVTDQQLNLSREINELKGNVSQAQQDKLRGAAIRLYAEDIITAYNLINEVKSEFKRQIGGEQTKAGVLSGMRP